MILDPNAAGPFQSNDSAPHAPGLFLNCKKVDLTESFPQACKVYRRLRVGQPILSVDACHVNCSLRVAWSDPRGVFGLSDAYAASHKPHQFSSTPRAVVQYSRDGSMIIVGESNGNIVGFDFESGEQIFDQKCGLWITGLDIAQKRHQLLARDLSSTIHIVGLSGGIPLGVRTLRSQVPIYDACYSPSGRYFAVADQLNVSIYRSSDLSLAAKSAETGPYYSVAFGPDEKQVAAVSCGGELRTFSLERKKKASSSRDENCAWSRHPTGSRGTRP